MPEFQFCACGCHGIRISLPTAITIIYVIAQCFNIVSCWELNQWNRILEFALNNYFFTTVLSIFLIPESPTKGHSIFYGNVLLVEMKRHLYFFLHGGGRGKICIAMGALAKIKSLS